MQSAVTAIKKLAHQRNDSFQLKLVCTRLRAIGVTGHVGVFGLHYDADNSRLYVVCAKHVTEAELLEHFVQFGAVEVKLNRDPMGASKVCSGKVKGYLVLRKQFICAYGLWNTLWQVFEY